MPRLRFRDRFFTPPVARAITSPAGILLAGAGASVAILAGLPAAAVAVAGAAAWAARVAFAIPREPRAERIDPFTLSEPWRRFVQEALQARSRFDEAVRRAQAGPLRDRLREIADRMQTGVDTTWRIARRGQALVEARTQIDVEQVRRELEGVERGGRGWTDDAARERTAEALRSQLATADRMERIIDDAYSRLRLLDARMDEAVARTLELAVRSDVDETATLAGLGADVDSVVTEMEALRQALEEAGGTTSTGSIESDQ